LEKMADVIEALNKTIEIFTSHSEHSFEDVISHGVSTIAEAVGLNGVVIYKKMENMQVGQIYKWDKLDGATVETDEPIMLVPIFTHGEFWGNVAFHSHFDKQSFKAYEDILRSAARLCANEVVIREQNQRLTLLSKAKDDFLSRISHEIRTPMNAILGLAEIQLRNESLPDKVRDGLSIIYNSGDSLLRIVNDLLDLSKIETQKLEIIPINYNIASLLSDSVQLNMLQVEHKPVNFKLEVAENIPVKLFGDWLRIKQILNNILSNAFKYTDKGEVFMSVLAEKSEKPEEVILIFRISDTGHGMTQEQLNALLIVEESRFNLVSKRLIQGTGLGMNIVHNLLDLMNGHMYAESELGKGTVFTIRIPQKPIGAEVLGKEMADNLRKFRKTDYSRKKKLQMVHDLMPYGSVLIVDDVVSNLYVTENLLAPYDMSIDTAESGFAAIDKIKSGNIYDIIFMDHMMPKMDGIEATKIIRELGYNKPIIALTANAVTGQSQVFLENGFDEFISKPINTKRLNSLLNKFIRDKRHITTVAKPAEINLLPLFAQDAKGALPVFESLLSNINDATKEDLHLYTIKAHAMKSSFANIGERAFSEIALELENAGREGNKSLIAKRTQVLIDALNAFIEKNEREIREHSTEKDENVAYLNKQLGIIEESCRCFDLKTAQTSIEKLKKIYWTKETEDTVNRIYELILFSDFEEAGLIAGNYARKINCG